MNKAAYQNIFKNEEEHFYYTGTFKEIIDLSRNYLQQIKFGKKIKILDAGCGTGLLTKKLDEFGDVIGVDTDPNAIKYSKRRRLHIFKASIDKLSFENNSFDVIVSVDVLYHRNVDEEKALNEFYRVLKPDGILILKLPAYDFLKGRHDIFVHTKRRYTNKSLSFILQKNGFQEIRSTYLASFLFLPALIKRSMERYFGLSNLKEKSDLKMPPKIINILLIVLFKIENYILKYIDLPFGLSVFSVSKKPKE